MGMARRAPADTYGRKRVIHSHAIQRLRERLRQGNNALRHLPDWDLGNRIDAVVDGLFDRGEDVRDRGDPTRIVALGDSFEEPLWAVVRVIGSRPREAVLTLLTRDIVEANVSKGHWQETTPGGLARIMGVAAPAAKLGDKIVNLDKIRASLPQHRPEPAPLPKAVKAPPSPPVPTAAPPKAPEAPEPKETRLVSYQAADGTMRYAEFPKDSVPRALGDLLNDTKVDRASVRVWREVKTRIRIEVDE